jgi:hypothetical protein
MSLKGNSGCKIEQQGDKIIKSASGSYVPRLREQAIKQKCATTWASGQRNQITGTKVLDINECTVNGEPFISVTMPFIEGDTVAEELLKCKGISTATDLAAFIMSNFAFNKVYESLLIFQRKCDDMVKKTPELQSELDEFMREFGPQLKELRAGYCHGDLTLENIIVGHKPDKYIKSSARVLHLIDFLDSFIDTPYVDIATVLQDSLCHWSYRYKELDEEQKRYLKNFTHEFLINVNGSLRANMKLILGFLLFKIYRIVPYAKDDVTKRWCSDNVKYVKSLFDCLPEPKDNGYYSQYVNLNDFWRE